MSPWIEPSEFKEIFSKVPRLTVEVVAVNNRGEVLLTKREINPCKGCWHMPGGTVYVGESLEEAVKRLAQQEIGTEPNVEKFLGYLEYPSHYTHGMDTPVGLAFRVSLPPDFAPQDDARWHTTIPPEMHGDQDEFLVQQGLLRRDENSSVFQH